MRDLSLQLRLLSFRGQNGDTAHLCVVTQRCILQFQAHKILVTLLDLGLEVLHEPVGIVQLVAQQLDLQARVRVSSNSHSLLLGAGARGAGVSRLSSPAAAPTQTGAAGCSCGRLSLVYFLYLGDDVPGPMQGVDVLLQLYGHASYDAVPFGYAGQKSPRQVSRPGF